MISTHTAWKMSVFGVILVRIFQHSDWIRRDTVSLHIQSECGKIWTRITPNTVTFYAVTYVDFCIFLCRTLNNFHNLLVVVSYLTQNKRTNYISNQLKSSQSVILFLPKTLPTLFSNAVKTENLRGIRIWESYLGDYIHVTFVP